MILIIRSSSADRFGGLHESHMKRQFRTLSPTYQLAKWKNPKLKDCFCFFNTLGFTTDHIINCNNHFNVVSIDTIRFLYHSTTVIQQKWDKHRLLAFWVETKTTAYKKVKKTISIILTRLHMKCITKNGRHSKTNRQLHIKRSNKTKWNTSLKE